MDPRGEKACFAAIEAEAEAVSNVMRNGNHPNVVKIFEASWQYFHEPRPGLKYVVDMELGDTNLDDYIKERFKDGFPHGIPLDEVWNTMVQISSGAN